MSLNTILATAPLTSTNFILKATGTTIGNSLIWDNGTNVGIGNQGTTYTLDVSGSLRSTNTAYFATTSGVVGIGTTSVNASTILAVAGSNTVTDARGMVSVNSTNASAADLGGSISLGGENGLGTSPYAFAKISGRKEGAGATYSGYLSLATTFSDGTITERMRIASTGAVTFTSGVTDAFKVINTSSTAYNSVMVQNDASKQVILGMGGSTLGNIYANTGYAGTVTATDFFLMTGTTERMRITSGGDVGIGQAPSDASFRLVIKGADTTAGKFAIYCYNSGGVDLFGVRNDGAFYTGTAVNSPYNLTSGSAANCFINTNGFLYRSTSSLKYKKNVQDYTKGLAEVLQLRPVSYESINEEESGNIYAGLIAEEVNDLGLTEFVQYRTDGTPDALSYANMIALLTKAIQELSKQNEELSNRLIKLESK